MNPELDFQLEPSEARVLGALLEKEIATPEYYPLSLNALVNACNQKSNRDPVVAYDDATVENALDCLRQKGLAVRISGESRVPKHAQRFTEKFNLGRREAAVVCVLLLRGPQTIGELRGRTERLYAFDDLEAVESTLNRLGELGFAKQLPRQAGFKESRYAQLLGGEVPSGAGFSLPAKPSAWQAVEGERSEPEAGGGSGTGLAERVSRLEAELADLRRQFDDFRRNFE